MTYFSTKVVKSNKCFSIFIWCFNHQLWWFKLNKWLFFPFILLPAIVRNTLWQMLFLECSSNPPKTITSIVWLQSIHDWILAEIYMDFRSVRLQVASRHWTSLGPSINLGPFTIRQTSKELALTCLDAWMIDAFFVTKNGLMLEQYWNIPPTSAQHGHFTREMVINSHIYH